MGKVPKSMGIPVPWMKLDLISLQEASASAPPPPETPSSEESTGEYTEKDFLCPICMQTIHDAFLTSCGHSFCYMCILQHLQNNNTCPCCAHYITSNHLYPNFLLNKFLKQNSKRVEVAKPATPFEKIRLALQQGCDVSVKELNDLLSVLSDKKKKMEQEEDEHNMQTLLYFLHCLWKKKREELSAIQNDLQYVEEDIDVVEGQRTDLNRVGERYSVKPRMLAGDANSGSNLQDVSQSDLDIARKNTVETKLGDLQECYLQKRREGSTKLLEQGEISLRNFDFTKRIGYHSGLEDFQAVLSTYTRYSCLKVIAEHKQSDLFHSANIVSSIDIDRDDKLFATAGVAKRIKVFEFSSVVNEPTCNQYPIVEMSTPSKLSCLSWNKHTNNYIASCDYEGIVTVWDIATRQRVVEYEEHEKRAWSVDFSRTEPTLLVSGSDDGKIKIWSTKQEGSVLNIDMKANVCSVKYNPGSSMYIAIGSADYHVYYYDLRNVSEPLQTFEGHEKAVSYVRFMSDNEIASASTDSTLRLWDIKDKKPLGIYSGHTNEKNFVGLSASGEYIACGSETNEVYVYHKAISRPAASHNFTCLDDDREEEEEEDTGPYFISAVCWKSDSPTMVCTNSDGTTKVLELAN